MGRTRNVRDGAREAGRTYRSADVPARTRAEHINAIFDGFAVNTYEAERVAQDALAAV